MIFISLLKLLSRQAQCSNGILVKWINLILRVFLIANSPRIMYNEILLHKATFSLMIAIQGL